VTSKTSFLSDYDCTAFFVTFKNSYVKCACNFVEIFDFVGFWTSALASVNSDLRSDLPHFITKQPVSSKTNTFALRGGPLFVVLSCQERSEMLSFISILLLWDWLQIQFEN